MPRPNWLVIVKRRSCSQLPRAHICIRAVHHIFHSKSDLMDADSDETPGPIHFNLPPRFLKLRTTRGGVNVVH